MVEFNRPKAACRRRRDRRAGPTLVCFAAIVLVASAPPLLFAADSTPHLDLQLILSASGSQVYGQPVALQMLQTQIGKISTKQEREKVDRLVRDFVKRGFRKTHAADRLFAATRYPEEDRAPRTAFLDAIQNSPYKLDARFFREVCQDYKLDRAGLYDFAAFVEPRWIQSGRTACSEQDAAAQPAYAAFLELLRSRQAPASLQEYLPLLYFGYQVFDGHQSDLDKEVQNSHLDSPALTAQRIQDFYTRLGSASYWDSTPATQSKRSWMSRKLAWRLFDGFSPTDWARLRPEVVLAMAKELAAAPKTADHRPVRIEEWFLKIGQTIKSAPGPVRTRSLLSYFIANSRIALAESFKALRPLFADDQAMFVALHQSPPERTPMRLWHQDADVLSDCIGLLEGFFSPDRADQWDLPLYGCLRDDYYRRYDVPLKDRLFSRILRQIGRNEAPLENAVRRQFLGDVHDAESYLLDSHRYEIAHFFLSSRRMTDQVPLPGTPVEVLQFAIDVYVSLSATEPELYRSGTLRQQASQGGFDPQSGEADRILTYINVVIGEAVVQMCHAFTGHPTVGNVRFSLRDQSRESQFESLLRTIVKWKGVLRVSHGDHQAARARPAVLELVSPRIIQEMKAAIKRRDKDQIVDMVRLTLKITVILEDDHYIEQMLAALRDDVFEIPEDTTLFRRRTNAELREMVDRFNALHSQDLVEALRAVGNRKYFEMFYDQLYVPLRSTYGFFRLVGAEPYWLYLKELHSADDSPPADALRRWQRELESFGRIRGATGSDDTGYINAEEAIAGLLAACAEQLKIDLWQDPHKLTLNRNVNLGVLYRLLFQTGLPGAGGGELKQLSSTHWKLPGLTDEQRSGCYRQVAVVFLKHIGDPALLDRSTSLDGQPQVYQPFDFFTLLYSLVELYEIHGFRFRGRDPSALYRGDPRQGIQREVLIGRGDLWRDKVDGTLRAAVFRRFWQDVSAGILLDDATFDQVVTLALLLPNADQNHEGEPATLAEYEKLKGLVFRHLATLLAATVDQRQRLRLLQWMCRLEASVYGLADEGKGFGYEPLHDEAARALPPSLMDDLALEAFRLVHINQGMAASGDRPLSLVAMAQVVEQIVDDLCRHYVLADSVQRYDLASQFILDAIRATRKAKVLEALQEEHLDEFWFLTTYCRDTIREANHRGTEDLTAGEKQAVVAVASRLMFLHAYFSPYVHAEFDKQAVHEQDYALPLFCMLQRDVKKPLVNLLDLYENTYQEGEPLVRLGEADEGAALEVPLMRPWELKTFLMCHNFLPIYLLEASLDDVECYCRLVDGEDVSLTAYSFRVLWERKDQARVSLESLCEEVFDGVDLNRDILAGTRQLADEHYLEYFFGDMRAVLDSQSRYSAEMPLNFDALVRRFAKLPRDPRWKNIEDRIRQKLAELNESEDADKLARYKTALFDVQHIGTKVNSVLGEGYKFFGSVLVEKFRSPFTMQRACEQACEKVAQQKATLPDDAYARYRTFYRSALFADKPGRQEEAGRFLEEVERAMVERFYPAADQPADQYLARRRSDYRALIEGLEAAKTQGIMAVAEKPAQWRTYLQRQYLDSGKRLLKSLFCGRYAPPGRPFLGDLVWETDQRGKRKARPLDYARRADDIRDLVLWIRESADRYTRVPEIREVFAAPGSIPVATGAGKEGETP